MTDEREVRAYLLPGLWNREDANGRSLDLDCTQDGGLDLIVDGKRHSLFAPDELKDRSYVGAFNPRVIEILKGKNHA